MKHVVGVSDMKVSSSSEDIIVTHSLGSCIGLSIYDPVAKVGGILHFQLPRSGDSQEKAKSNPFMFADTGIPEMFKASYKLGAEKKRIIVRVAGGSNIMDQNGFFNIGRRNYIMMKKILWKNGVLIEAEDVGGDSWRNMTIMIESGEVWVKNGSGQYQL